MYNREFIWETAKGERIKIKNLSSSHLTNILNLLNKKFKKFALVYGKKTMRDAKKNIKQEIRYRKLNRININNNDELF